MDDAIVVWRNEIVETGEEDPGNLKANALNWRIHTVFQQEAMLDALEELGWLSPVIVNRKTSDEWGNGEREVPEVLDGHLRVELAIQHRQPSIPVQYVDLGPRQQALALATYDPLGALAEPDPQQVLELLSLVEAEGEALDRLVNELREEAEALLQEVPPVPMAEATEEEEPTSYTCPKCGCVFHVED